MRAKFFMLVVGVGLLMGAGQLFAHHAFSAEFDANRPIKLRATVTKMDWVNPHAWIYVDVKGPDGKVTSWMIEAAAPNAMIRRGFSRESLPAGSEIIIEGYQAKDGSNTGSGRNLTFADGRTLFMGSTGTGAPDDAPAAK